MLIRFSNAIASRVRQLIYRLMGVRILGHCSFGHISIPRNFKSITISNQCGLDDRVTLLSVDENNVPGKILIGERTYINRNTIIDACSRVQIGDDCAIGPNCYITDHDHTFSAGKRPLNSPLNSRSTIIKNEVWIGANVVILKGVTIGKRSIVGAGSVVTKNIPENAVVVGNPAKIIKKTDES
jgi:acetyltransferase-like isoleucine patch superfamily enzyme